MFSWNSAVKIKKSFSLRNLSFRHDVQACKIAQVCSLQKFAQACGAQAALWRGTGPKFTPEAPGL